MSKNYWEVYFNAIKQQDWEQAETSLQHLNNIEAENPQVKLKLGDIYQRMGKTANAISAYHESAWILKKKGFIQKALALYKIILRLDSYNEEALKLSKELMIEIEGAKKQKTSSPYFEACFEEEKPQEETGLPLGLEEEVEQKTEEEVSISAGFAKEAHEQITDKPYLEEDLVERTSISEKPSAQEHPSEIPERKEQEMQPEAVTPEIGRGREEDTIYIPSLFASLPPDEIIHLVEKIIPYIYEPGQIIIEEGDSGDSIFLIKSGCARVVAHIFGKEIELAILSPGDVFGEVAFLTGRPRTASVIASDMIEVLEFNKLLLEDIFERYPDGLRKLHDFYECRVQDTVEKVKSKIKKTGH